MKTTLRKIKSFSPCIDGWKKLCKGLGTTDLETEVSLLQILEINGVEDAYWSLRCYPYQDYCLILADVAESVLHIFEEKYPNDNKPRKAIEAIRLFKNGKITKEQLLAAADSAAAAHTAAHTAASDAADAAYYAYYAYYTYCDSAAYAHTSAASAASAASAYTSASASADYAAAAAAAASYASAAVTAAASASNAVASSASNTASYAVAAAADASNAVASYASASASVAARKKQREINEQILRKHLED